jgi:hypothetical protein
MPVRSLIFFFFILLFVSPALAQSQDVTVDDFAYAKTDRELNPAGALLRSVAIPGWGQRYVDKNSWRRGQIHLAADILLISSWVYLHSNANMLENNMYTFSRSYAHIDLRAVSRRIEIAAGNYLSLEEYNQAMLRSRNWDRILEDIPANRWQWDSDDHRQEYLAIRSRMDSARQQIPAVISLMVVNRVVSGIHAFIQARNHNSELPYLTFGIPAESRGKGFQATLQIPF